MNDDFVVVAQVIKPYGVRGAVRVRVLSDDPDRPKTLERVFIDGRAYRVRRRHPHPNGYVMELEGVETVEQAEALRNRYMEIPASESPPLGEDAWYHFQLVGLDVVTTGGEALGSVAEVIETGSNDVLVVRRPGARDALIPLVDDIVVNIDLPARRITIDPVPGMLEP